VEKHLSESEGPFYYGKGVTEADVRLFTTVIRFDVAYVQHFKVCFSYDVLRDGTTANNGGYRRILGISDQDILISING